MKTAYAGQHERTDRSDCRIALSLKKSGSLDITVNSKVKLLFEKAIRKTLTDGLNAFPLNMRMSRLMTTAHRIM